MRTQLLSVLRRLGISVVKQTTRTRTLVEGVELDQFVRALPAVAKGRIDLQRDRAGDWVLAEFFQSARYPFGRSLSVEKDSLMVWERPFMAAWTLDENGRAVGTDGAPVNAGNVREHPISKRVALGGERQYTMFHYQSLLLSGIKFAVREGDLTDEVVTAFEIAAKRSEGMNVSEIVSEIKAREVRQWAADRANERLARFLLPEA